MASGGARATSGPAPDPNALRRDRDGASWITLPAEGRTDDPPEWPLTEASDRELELWAREWRRPQAVMWERNGQEAEVALYVRSLREAETPEAAVTLRNLVRQLQEALGISLPGMARNHWRIGAAEEQKQTRQRASAPSARDRFRVVTGGGEG